jgi:hypothetical protein
MIALKKTDATHKTEDNIAKFIEEFNEKTPLS